MPVMPLIACVSKLPLIWTYTFQAKKECMLFSLPKNAWPFLYFKILYILAQPSTTSKEIVYDATD